MGLFSKIFNGLKKTKESLSKKLSSIFVGELNDEFFEELEYVLVSSDINIEATENIISDIKKLAKKQKIKTEDDFKGLLRSVLIEKLDIEPVEDIFPTLIEVVGVNGVGKTTVIGKMAHFYKEKNKNVLLIAGDTFRAAASEQLNEWSKRSKARIVKYSEGADPGAVVFDGISSAKSKKDDVVLVDTAGRLQNKVNLMEELNKVNKIIDREWKGQIKHYLVLDATTGQNALSQVEIFNEIIGIDGIVLTKLDGTSKGGVVFSIVQKFNIPICFIGVGEGIDDLQEFDAKQFVDSII